MQVASGSLSRHLYGEETVNERHRHRYEFNNNYASQLVSAGLVLAGHSEDGTLVEVVEIDDHPGLLDVSSTPNLLLHQGMVIRCLVVLLKLV